MRLPLSAALLLGLAACHSSPATKPDESAITHTFNGIGPDETVHFTGTEPFWGGEAKLGQMTYTTPEDQKGTSFPVERFAGNSGLGFSGSYAGQSFDMAVTRGKCSDGMSDRSYPFTATLRIGGEQRNGCAWTNTHPFTGQQAP